MTIDVTQGDIDAGKRTDCFNCPIALAISRAIPSAWVRVGCGIVQIKEVGCKRRTVVLPEVAIVFIRYFDHGIFTPIPFTFTLDYEKEGV